ncbi:MAG: oligopeptide ABC transporter ATP-binding protein OppF [Bdellovibrionales bacterium GWA2_49_15]|nr:MAG: oligopeptide ABC transporter ATP-binding protein OppF [Bdellovibrionales bacterium GWA2_49_15]
MLKVQDLKKYYLVKKWPDEAKTIRALDGVSFHLPVGKTLGVVGESGCGKSTLARTLLHLETPTSGAILWENQSIAEIGENNYRKNIQMIFQDPYNSLNPRKRAIDIVCAPLQVNTNLSKQEIVDRALELLLKVGIAPSEAYKYPHMYSGGQRQRLGIARALILGPKAVICDEPVSALDVSIQAQVLNLLLDLQETLGLSYIFISHDLGVVSHVSDDIMVMYLGKAVEQGPKEELMRAPMHPYTRALWASSPSMDRPKAKEALALGELPSPMNPPSGCSYHKRCPYAEPMCREKAPELLPHGKTLVACHFTDKLKQNF